MSAAVEELQRVGLKVFAVDGAALRPRELVPVFHRWIQQRALSDQLLIDVADYEHVPEGPGVMLVAHGGNFSLDLGDGRMGLVYTRKEPSPGTLIDRLRAVVRTTLAACSLLEGDAALAGRLRFRGDELYLFANDRLRAPNTPATASALRSAVDDLVGRLYAGARCVVTPEPDPRERPGFHVKAPAGVDIGELAARLG